MRLHAHTAAHAVRLASCSMKRERASRPVACVASVSVFADGGAAALPPRGDALPKRGALLLAMLAALGCAMYVLDEHLAYAAAGLEFSARRLHARP